MAPGGHAQVLHLNQGDSDFGIVFHLYCSSGIFNTSGVSEARVFGRKPDGTAYEMVATLSGSDVILAGDASLTDAWGKGELEIRLKRQGKSLFSQNIPLYIEKEADGGT